MYHTHTCFPRINQLLRYCLLSLLVFLVPIQIAAQTASPTFSFDSPDTEEEVLGSPTIPTLEEEEEEGEADIYLNFENATLSSVIMYLAEQRKINIVPEKKLEAIKVSLTTRTPLTLRRAWNVLLTLLDMNGYAILQVNDLYRVVAAKHK